MNRKERVFSAARPKGREGGQGKEVSLRAAITASLPALEKSFADQPLVESRLRMTLGVTFSYLGEDAAAEAQFSLARALYTAHLGPDHIFEAIRRYAADRSERHRRLRAVVDAIDAGE